MPHFEIWHVVALLGVPHCIFTKVDAIVYLAMRVEVVLTSVWYYLTSSIHYRWKANKFASPLSTSIDGGFFITVRLIGSRASPVLRICKTGKIEWSAVERGLRIHHASTALLNVEKLWALRNMLTLIPFPEFVGEWNAFKFWKGYQKIAHCVS